MSNIKYTLKDNELTGFGTYKGLLKDIEESKTRNWNNSFNQSEVNRFISNTDSSHTKFAGGTWEDVTNLKNLDGFKKQLKEMEKHKLREKVLTKLEFNPKRKRRLSEHDGDYDFDKRWEIKPFSNCRKEMLPMNVIDVNVDMSISAGTKSEDINKYGAIVWSLIQLIESLGIQCNINIINDVSGLSSDMNSKLIFNIKKSGEYISPVALATCFQSVFFRRAIFAGMVLACDENKKQVCGGLGSPRTLRTSKHIWFENGAVYTKSGGLFNIDEVQQCIVDMVTKRK